MDGTNISQCNSNGVSQEKQGFDSSKAKRKEDEKEISSTIGIQYKSEGMPSGEIYKGTQKANKESNLSPWLIYGAIIAIVAMLLYHAFTKDWSSLIRVTLIYMVLHGLARILRQFMEENPNYAQRYIRKVSKALPIFLILLVFAFVFGSFKSMRPISSVVFLVSLIGVAFSFTALRQYKHLLTPIKIDSDRIEDKMKSELFLHDVKNYQPSFPKGLNWIGGFMTPLFPFFTVVNKNWKKKLNREAFIHEHMHIHLMIYEGWSIYIVMGILLFPIMTWFIGLRGIIGALFNMFVFAGLLTMHEKVTFGKTKEFAAKYGITTRAWDSKIAKKYLFIYFTWFMVVFFIIQIIIALGQFIKEVV